MAIELSDQLLNLPIVAPSYRFPPYRYNHIRRLTIVAESDIDSVRRFVPEPLECVGNRFLFWIEHRVDEDPSPTPHAFTHPFDTYEAAVEIPVRFRGTLGNYIPMMWVPVSEAEFARALAGRELQGLGKKLARFHWDERLLDDEIVARLTRNNVDLADVKVKLTGEAVELPKNSRIIGIKMIPRIDGKGYDVHKVVALEQWKIKTIASKGGRVESLNIGSSEEDPLARLRPTRVHGALFTIWSGETLQPCGRDLADLLAESARPAKA